MMTKKTRYLSLLIGLTCVAFTAGATEVVEGEIGPGAVYSIAVPDDWNGDLVLYAHGFIDPEAPIALPTADDILPLRDLLLANGYAMAYSSYSQNGLAVKDGAQRTKQLRGIFAATFSKPDRTFLVGHSLGALVCVNLAEKHPQHYDGVLAISGMLGGSQAEIDYVGHLRVLFELYYPEILPGGVGYVPPGLDLVTDVVIPIATAIQVDPTGAVGISMIDQTPVPWSSGAELVESFYRGLGFFFRGFEDVNSRTHEHGFFDNVDTVYTGVLPQSILDDINANADRVAATPDAANTLEHNYVPTGDLRVPVLTVHTLRDPSVPIFHEALFAAAVTDQGREDLLVQRTLNRYGHTEAITAVEVFEAFEELVDWVDTGVQPAPSL